MVTPDAQTGSVADTKRGRDSATAAVSSVASKNGDGNEGTAEAQIKYDAEESEEHDTSQEEGEKDGEEGIDYRRSRYALDGPIPYRYIEVVLVDDTDVVREGTENEKRDQKLECSDQ